MQSVGKAAFQQVSLSVQVQEAATCVEVREKPATGILGKIKNIGLSLSQKFTSKSRVVAKQDHAINPIQSKIEDIQKKIKENCGSRSVGLDLIMREAVKSTELRTCLGQLVKDIRGLDEQDISTVWDILPKSIMTNALTSVQKSALSLVKVWQNGGLEALLKGIQEVPKDRMLVQEFFFGSESGLFPLSNLREDQKEILKNNIGKNSCPELRGLKEALDFERGDFGDLGPKIENMEKNLRSHFLRSLFGKEGKFPISKLNEADKALLLSSVMPEDCPELQALKDCITGDTKALIQLTKETSQRLIKNWDNLEKEFSLNDMDDQKFKDLQRTNQSLQELVKQGEDFVNTCRDYLLGYNASSGTSVQVTQRLTRVSLPLKEFGKTKSIHALREFSQAVKTQAKEFGLIE